MATTIKLNRRQTHSGLQTETLRLSAALNTRLTMETVIIALLAVAANHPDEMLSVTKMTHSSLYGLPEDS